MLNFDEMIDAVDAAQNFSIPQVEEILIDYMKNERAVLNLLMLFARHFVNLKRVIVPNPYHHSGVKFDVSELNRAREKLENACELTIFSDYDGNPTSLNLKLIKSKFVQFTYGDDLNPFQKWFMPTD